MGMLVTGWPLDTGPFRMLGEQGAADQGVYCACVDISTERLTSKHVKHPPDNLRLWVLRSLLFMCPAAQASVSTPSPGAASASAGKAA